MSLSSAQVPLNAHVLEGLDGYGCESLDKACQGYRMRMGSPSELRPWFRATKVVRVIFYMCFQDVLSGWELETAFLAAEGEARVANWIS